MVASESNLFWGIEQAGRRDTCQDLITKALKNASAWTEVQTVPSASDNSLGFIW